MLKINFDHMQKEIDKRKNNEEIIATIDKIKLNKNLYDDFNIKYIANIINNTEEDVGKIIALEYCIYKLQENNNKIKSTEDFYTYINKYSDSLSDYCDSIEENYIENTICEIVENYSIKSIESEILNSLVDDLLSYDLKLNIMYRVSYEKYDFLLNNYTNDKSEIMKTLGTHHQEFIVFDGERKAHLHITHGNGEDIIKERTNEYSEKIENTNYLIKFLNDNKDTVVIEDRKPNKYDIINEVFNFISNKHDINLDINEIKDINKELKDKDEMIKYITNFICELHITNETKSRIIKDIDVVIDEALQNVIINSTIDDLLKYDYFVRVDNDKDGISYEQNKIDIINSISLNGKNNIYTIKENQIFINKPVISLDCKNNIVDIEVINKKYKNALVNTSEKVKQIDDFVSNKNKIYIKKTNKMKI